MTKELFINSIEAVKQQREKDSIFADTLGGVFKNVHTANLLPDNCVIIDQLINILEIEMSDDCNWVSYFIYDLDYGKDFKMGYVTDNGKDVDISDSGKLWEFLNKEKK